MRILISAIEEASKKRPDGYKKDVLSRGKMDGKFLVIEPKEYEFLLRKYSSPQPATWKQKAKNFGNAVVDTTGRAIRGEPVKASEDAVTARKSICEACEHLKGSVCELCGCYYPAKIRLAGQSCPKGKW